MNEKMFIHWDTEGDFLEVRFGEPTLSYYTDLGEDIFERKDEKTGELKGYAFFNVLKKKIKEPKDIVVDLPIIKSRISS